MSHKRPAEKLDHPCTRWHEGSQPSSSYDPEYSLAWLVRFLEPSTDERDASRFFAEVWGLHFEEAWAELTAPEGV